METYGKLWRCNMRIWYQKYMKYIVENKKIKNTLYVVAILWLAVLVQVVTNQVFKPKNNILEAFVNTKSQISYLELEMVGFYGDSYMSDGDKKQLIIEISKSIGLQIEGTMELSENKEHSEVFYQKEGKNAESLIKVISKKEEDNTKHYLLVRLKVFSNPDGVLKFRSVLEDVFAKLKIRETQTTMEVSSTFVGKLNIDEMNQVADRMIDNLDGKIAYENRSEELYTIYGYTAILPEYIEALGTKLNIHVAITYNESEDKTEVILATPVIRGTY